MDQVTAAALKAARQIIERYRLEESKATIDLHRARLPRPDQRRAIADECSGFRPIVCA